MKKVTQEQIQFIDNYLKNSGVEYIDVRLEMLDHVASAVEIKMEEDQQNFYDTFKAYMWVHKKELIASGMQYRWSIDKKLLKLVFKNLFNLYVLGSFAMLIAFIYYSSIKDISWLYAIVMASPLVYLIIAAIQYRKFKYSFLQRFGLYGSITSSLSYQFIIHSIEGNPVNFYVVLIVLWLHLSVVFSANQSIKNYQKQVLIG
ncbi:hypothetical protein ACFQ3R_04290 [Mesonia ostreae]|uniref:DUF2157 domain-containing protein n=1 Tax=Mesonia ostreae TaxID=861110 RepID=A0ABU2KIT6_9FLAO|nr:hypothetical protein [Mesonia ostreae]MDT0294631.1 hypothetical protein [Mesonia ostreae]